MDDVAALGTGPDVLLYRIGNTLYVNVTPACTARCMFCDRGTEPVVRGIDLRLPHPVPTQRYMEELETELARWHPDELVFCGFGEPTLRLDLVKTVAAAAKGHGLKVRLNTNGHGSAVHGRPITQELRGLVDCISVSLNASNARDYERVMRPHFANAFEAACAFVREAHENVPCVVVTALEGLPGVDLEATRALAASLGARFRLRQLGRVG